MKYQYELICFNYLSTRKREAINYITRVGVYGNLNILNFDDDGIKVE